MKIAKVALTLLAAGAVLFVLGRLFLAELDSAPRAAGPQAVLFSAPPGYAVVEAGEAGRGEAARRLLAAIESSPAGTPVGVHFSDRGAEIYWLIERRDGAAETLLERVAGANGTRLESSYSGEVERRLRWAAEHGDLAAPGTAAAESRNLYH